MILSAKDKVVTLYSTAGSGNPNQTSIMSNSGYSVPGYAFINEVKSLDLKSGTTEVKLTDIADLADPGSITFNPKISSSGIKLIEQNFNFNLVNSNVLTNTSIGKSIAIKQDSDSKIIEGTLLGYDNKFYIVKTSNGKTQVIKDPKIISYSEANKDLSSRPELYWKINSNKSGKYEVLTGYETKGMTWWVNYLGTYTENRDGRTGKLDLSAFATLVNKSGVDHLDSKIKLIAGDVNKAGRDNYEMSSRSHNKYSAAMAMDSTGIQNEAVMDYHMYTLDRKVDLPNNSAKQIAFFDTVQGIPVTKRYIYQANNQRYYGNVYADKGVAESKDEISVWLQFKNTKASGLGSAMPSGVMRINKTNISNNEMQFVGEDVITRKAKDEDIVLNLGKAFDVKGKRKQISYSYDKNRKRIEEVIEIEVDNHKDIDVEVEVMENLYRSKDWEIRHNTHDFTKESANSVKFKSYAEAEGKSVIRYEVIYKW
jgi:hypothetical protein